MRGKAGIKRARTFDGEGRGGRLIKTSAVLSSELVEGSKDGSHIQPSFDRLRTAVFLDQTTRPRRHFADARARIGEKRSNDLRILLAQRGRCLAEQRERCRTNPLRLAAKAREV